MGKKMQIIDTNTFIGPWAAWTAALMRLIKKSLGNSSNKEFLISQKTIH